MAARRARLRLPDRQAVTRLARAAQRDDARALNALLTALRPAFVGFFARRIGRDVAEDLAQMALIELAEVVERARPERLAQHTTTIAYALLRGETTRLVRERRAHAAVGLNGEAGWPADQQQQAEYDELVRAVDQASAMALPSELASIVLGVLRDLTFAEIAAELGTDPATVRLSLLRARDILRRELQPYIEH